MSITLFFQAWGHGTEHEKLVFRADKSEIQEVLIFMTKKITTMYDKTYVTFQKICYV